LRASESWTAASTVIEARAGIAERAMRAPLTGDYAELSRMVPEKIEALSRASAALAGHSLSFGTAFWTEAQFLGAMMLKGRPPTLAEWTTLAERNSAYALTTMETIAAAASGAVAPVHRTVTANARRLSGTRRKG
jgi:hypothetical protein